MSAYTQMRIPFVDLQAQYRAHRADIDAAVQRTLEQAAFIGGPAVAEFEAAFARLHGVSHFAPCANGTDALFIVLRMMGIGPGDEVITSAHSWIATSEAVSLNGATPVFVDVDECYTLDVAKLEAAITPRTRAVIPVHLCGQPAQMDRLGEICRKYGLLMIEDCAQAHLAEFDGQMVGTFGDAATF